MQTKLENRASTGEPLAADNEHSMLVDPTHIKKIRSTIFRLAGPSLVEMLLINLTQMLNMIMVGRVGSEAVAAVGLTSQPFLLLMSIFMALNVGTTAIVARSIGAGNRQDANRAASQSFAINIVLAVIVALTGFFMADKLLRLMGGSEEIVAHGLLYAKLIFLSIGFVTISMSLTAVLRGSGDTKTPMKINVLANIIDACLGFPLIYGFFGLPKLGVTGAAVSTMIAQIVATVWVVTIMLSGKYSIRIKAADCLRFDRALILRILTIGFPTAIEQLVMRLGMLVFVKIAASLGTVALAATQIAFNVLGLTFMPGMAFSIAASTLIGQALGAENPDLAEKYGWQVRKIGMIVAGIIGLGFIVFAPYIMMLYTTEAEVIHKGTVGLRIMGLIQISQASQFILGGALRGAGDTRFPLYSTLIGVWGFRVFLSLLLVYVFKWDIAGIWTAAAIDQFVRSLLIYKRYKLGKWKSIRI